MDSRTFHRRAIHVDAIAFNLSARRKALFMEAPGGHPKQHVKFDGRESLSPERNSIRSSKS